MLLRVVDYPFRLDLPANPLFRPFGKALFLRELLSLHRRNHGVFSFWLRPMRRGSKILPLRGVFLPILFPRSSVFLGPLPPTGCKIYSPDLDCPIFFHSPRSVSRPFLAWMFCFKRFPPLTCSPVADKSQRGGLRTVDRIWFSQTVPLPKMPR